MPHMVLWSWILAVPVPAVPAWHLTLSPRASVSPSLKWAWGFPGGSAVKNPPVMQEMWVHSLGQEDSLEEGMATHSSILAQKIPQTKEPGRLQSIGSPRVGHN